MSCPPAMSSRLLALGREQLETECARLLHDVHVTRNQSYYVLRQQTMQTGATGFLRKRSALRQEEGGTERTWK